MFFLDDETKEMEMSFYLDAKQQENPPKPNNPALYITTRPELTVYTRTIGTVFENHPKKSHSTLRAKRATFTFKMDKS